MPAKAGIQDILYQIFWIPAFAGMTDCIADNSPTAHLVRVFFQFTTALIEPIRTQPPARKTAGLIEEDTNVL